jgi:hypothetical protein
MKVKKLNYLKQNNQWIARLPFGNVLIIRKTGDFYSIFDKAEREAGKTENTRKTLADAKAYCQSVVDELVESLVSEVWRFVEEA